ncbi:alpha/beta fold hydrolase [Sulfitobacter aestuariivivens]
MSERIWDASQFPDVHFEVITGAGHVCNLEKPDLYNASLTGFIKRVVG